MSVIVSAATQQLVVPRVRAVVTLFPMAHRLAHLGQDHLVLPHGVRESMLLRRLQIPVPNPMLRYYDWKGGKPFEVQKKTCDLLTMNPRAYVLNDMGTGKTKAALWAWDYLHSVGCAGKLLVVAPLSTLNFVWAREAFATLPHRKAVVLHGSKTKREERLRDPEADIFIINHDGLKVIQQELEARTDIDTLVLDELAVYRNESARSKSMRKFAARFEWAWGMTGAPMPNEPTDVWAQAKIITPLTVPKYLTHARDMLMKKIDNFKWVPKADSTEKAFAMLQPSVRFKLDDVVELPESIFRTIDVDLSAEQQKVYAKMVREFKVMIGEKTITAVNAGAAMSKLLQVSAGWVYTVNPEFVALDCTPRLAELENLIMSASNKVLVFAQFRHVVEGLSQFLTAKGIEHAVVHGDIKDRDQIFNLFQNTAKYKVLLAHPQCLAHGLTLTAADTTIWFSPTSSLEIYEQANARIRRVGQRHKQQFIHLQGTPVERKIYALLRNKQRVQDKLLDMLEEASR